MILLGNAKARLIRLILFDCVFTGEIEMTIDDEKDPRKTRSARRKSRSTRSKTKTLEYYVLRKKERKRIKRKL